jgi:hypothetical protein
MGKQRGGFAVAPGSRAPGATEGPRRISRQSFAARLSFTLGLTFRAHCRQSQPSLSPLTERIRSGGRSLGGKGRPAPSQFNLRTRRDRGDRPRPDRALKAYGIESALDVRPNMSGPGIGAQLDVAVRQQAQAAADMNCV